MRLGNDSLRWGVISIALHWLTVLLIITIVAIGLYMTEMPNSMQKLRTYALHKSLGLTVLGLSLARIGWRAFAGAPGPVGGTPPWQRRAAAASHTLLYLLLLALPLSGWAYNSAANFALQWFGLFNLPRLVAADAELKALFLTLHNGLFYALLALALVHAGAAIWHHRRGDATLARMLPVLEPRDEPNPPTEPDRP